MLSCSADALDMVRKLWTQSHNAKAAKITISIHLLSSVMQLIDNNCNHLVIYNKKEMTKHKMIKNN